MNHYCTYFDRGFLVQGLALWRSLAAHDPDAVLWVLALDDFTAATLRQVGGTWMRVVALAELEEGDPALVAAKASRTRVEYYFTLSPCWPRWLLAKNPEMEWVAYVDADMAFFASPEPVFTAMEAAGASVLITAHRFPEWLDHYERHGKFNVGILVFRNDARGRDCLDDWRTRCLAWCHDRLEEGKYADQKYLDDWPARLGGALIVLEHPGVNLAPWNWMNHRHGIKGNALQVDGQPVILFHFARFRAIAGDWWWQSGQLDYGVMPTGLRNALYGWYWRLLAAARAELRCQLPNWKPARRPLRLNRMFGRELSLRVLFGSDWLRISDKFVSGRLGLGRWSGRSIAKLRRILFRD